MKQYLDLVKDVLENGIDRTDRTGTGTRSVFGRTMRFDMADGFPMVTTKKVAFRLPVEEMLWFLTPDCGDNNKLKEKNIHIWDEWEDEDGQLGRVYGCNWRRWPLYEKNKDNTYSKVGEVDQVQRAIDLIKNDPTSRRIIVEGWNVGELHEMALPPCHKTHQLYCDLRSSKLSMRLEIRSNDIGLGNPFNVTQYALLLHMYAHLTGYTPGELIINIGDAHIYLNHIDALREQLTREPYELPKLVINREVKSIDEFKYEDFSLINYRHHPVIKMDVSI